MNLVKKLLQFVKFLIAVMIVIVTVGYGLFAVKTMDVKDQIEVIQTNTYTVTLKRQLNDDMYAIVYVDTPSLGRDDKEYVDGYMKYSTTSSYTLYKANEIIATDKDVEKLSVSFGLDIYGEDIRVIEDVVYFDENDKEHWFSYRKSTRITFEGENEKRKGIITKTKDMTPTFINNINLSIVRFGAWINEIRK